MEPASRIIELLGGPTRVASIAGVHRTRVSNWKRPRDVGGTGGVIPHWHMQKLIDAARAEGVDLSPQDFVPLETEAKIKTVTPSSAPASPSTREVS